MTVTVSSDAGGVQIREAVDDLLSTLKSLHETMKQSRSPEFVEIYHEKGTTLGLGLGREVTVLGFIGPQGEPPYLASRGSSHESGAVTFLFGGQETEFPLWQAIPLAAAWDAVRGFVLSGEPPPGVDWERL